jgi:peptidoglycan/LPS O-acetylase OafA/YrhL
MNDNNNAVKSAVESALIALLAAACCLWFLISAANLDEPPPARIALLAIGLVCMLVAHWTFMAIALKRSGRGLLPWMLAIVLLAPVGTAAFLAVLASDDSKPPQQA